MRVLWKYTGVKLICWQYDIFDPKYIILQHISLFMKIYSNLISLGSVQDGILLLVSADIPWDLKMLYSTLTRLWVLQFSASLDAMFKCDFLLIF